MRSTCGLKNGRKLSAINGCKGRSTIALRLAHGARKIHLINNLLTRITLSLSPMYVCGCMRIRALAIEPPLKAHAKVQNIYFKLIILLSPDGLINDT